MGTIKAGTKFQRVSQINGDDFQEIITVAEVDPEDPTEGRITIEAGFIGLSLHLQHDFWTTLTGKAFCRTIQDFTEV